MWQMLPYLAKELSGAELLFFSELLGCVHVSTYVLHSADGEPVNGVYGLATTIGRPYKTVWGLLRSLIKKQVIIRIIIGRDICYAINPYVIVDYRQVIDAYKSYENTLWGQYNHEIVEGRNNGDQ